ncbi:MAG: stage V sporulation protein AE [Clostridia bacterium]
MDYFMILKAFIVGGLICGVSQILIDKTKLTPARILVFYVTLGVVLQGFGIYEKLVDFAGSGATVPLLGFGYTLANGVRDAVIADGLLGALTGGATAASGGITASIFFGFIMSVIGKSGDKT